MLKSRKTRLVRTQHWKEALAKVWRLTEEGLEKGWTYDACKRSLTGEGQAHHSLEERESAEDGTRKEHQPAVGQHTGRRHDLEDRQPRAYTHTKTRQK
jgi:hypothetical protein